MSAVVTRVSKRRKKPKTSFDANAKNEKKFAYLREEKSDNSFLPFFFTLEFARTRIYKTWVRKEKAPGLSVNERTNPTLCAEGTR